MTNSQEILNGPYGKFYKKFGDPTEELHLAYNSWLADMAARPGTKLQPFEFDPIKYPEQSIYVPKVEAKPAFPNIPDWLYYNGFKFKIGMSLGMLTTNHLLHQFENQPTSAQDPTPLPARLRANQAQRKNTLAIYSHSVFQEFGYGKGLKHIAKRDRHNIDFSGALISNLMTRQRYGGGAWWWPQHTGKTLTEHFRQAGHVYYSNPKSESADKHGVPESASDLTNALFRKVIKPDLKAGGLELDIALAGSEVKPIINEQKELSHYVIPQVEPASANLLTDFHDAFSITMVGPPMAESWQMAISDIYDVEELLKTNSTADVTDMIYGGIRQELERFTHREVVYNKVSRDVGRAALNS